MVVDDLEVVWNGVNDGHDGDLLTNGIRHAKHEDRYAHDRDHLGGARDKVLAALPTSQAEAITLRQVIQRSGCYAQAVGNALDALKARGVLGSVAISPAARHRRAPQLYWRRA